MIDNFDTIEKFLKFDTEYFYKFECLIRNTDGDNILYDKNISNTRKNLLVKSWYVDTATYFWNAKNEMKTLCDITGGRLYITLDRKSVKKLLSESLKEIINILDHSAFFGAELPPARTLCKLFNSKSSVVETSDKTNKTIMFDIDKKDKELLDLCVSFVEHNHQKPIVLETKKGWHVVCYKKFNTEKIMDNLCEWAKVYNCYLSTDTVREFVSCEPNKLGLVYLPNLKEG